MVCGCSLLQLTNASIGAVAANSPMPLGVPTQANLCTNGMYVFTSSQNDTVYITKSGQYRITYVASLTVAEAGNIVISLVQNGNVASPLITTTVTAPAAGTYNVVLDFVVDVPRGQSWPRYQIYTTGAITGGVSNLIFVPQGR